MVLLWFFVIIIIIIITTVSVTSHFSLESLVVVLQGIKLPHYHVLGLFIVRVSVVNLLAADFKHNATKAFRPYVMTE